MPRGFTLADLPRTELDVARDEDPQHYVFATAAFKATYSAFLCTN
jgi:hypothetical protein